MSGPPRIRSINNAEADPSRQVLRPAGNNAACINSRNPASKPGKKLAQAQTQQQEQDLEDNKMISSPSGPRKLGGVQAVLRQQEMKAGVTRAMNASCSSDASSDSSYSRASSGKLGRRNIGVVSGRRNGCGPKGGSVDNVVWIEKVQAGSDDCEGVESIDGLKGKKRCSWITANTDPNYAAFHDEEWGVPVHDDKKLFELLSLSGALAELAWPLILSKRHLFREAFLDFDPIAVSQLNEKKVVLPGSIAISLLSEPKVRAILENARQFCKVTEEFGSFDKYIWNFVNNKPLVSHFRYPRQVPVKTSKAEFISKDLVRRGFRSVSPTVVYSFMQVAGLTNDHLVSCFRFKECMGGEESTEVIEVTDSRTEARKHKESSGLGLAKSVDKLSVSSTSN